MNARHGFCIYLLAITYLCLFPWQFDATLGKPLYMWPADSRRVVIVDAILNLVLLMPLGFMGRFVFPGRGGIWAVLGIAATWTLGVEALQTMLPGRTSSVADVATNFLGAVAGLWMAPLVSRHLLLSPGASKKIHWDTRVVFLLGCFLVGHMFPFIPNLRVSQIRAMAAALPETAGGMPLLTASITGLLLALLLRRMTNPGMPAAAAFGITVGLLVGRLLFPDSVPPGVILLAGVAGAAVGASLPGRFLLRYLWAPLLVYLVLRQLAPFTFSPHPADFSWWPFAQLMEMARTAAMRILFEKGFIYGTIVFLLYHRSGNWMLAVLPCAFLLGLGEWVQRWIAGRTPDSLDPLLPVLLTLVLLLLPGFAPAGAGTKVQDRPSTQDDLGGARYPG